MLLAATKIEDFKRLIYYQHRYNLLFPSHAKHTGIKMSQHRNKTMLMSLHLKIITPLGFFLVLFCFFFRPHVLKVFSLYLFEASEILKYFENNGLPVLEDRAQWEFGPKAY